MSIGLYEASVPVFLRYLDRLVAMLGIAESHAQDQRLDASALLGARLAPDMLAPYGEFPPTFSGLRSRIARVVSLLRGLEPGQFAGAESRVVTSLAGDAVVSLEAPEFLLQYALPNFFFHVTAAYAILRSRGVPLGKQQFDGFHAYPGPSPGTTA